MNCYVQKKRKSEQQRPKECCLSWAFFAKPTTDCSWWGRNLQHAVMAAELPALRNEAVKIGFDGSSSPPLSPSSPGEGEQEYLANVEEGEGRAAPPRHVEPDANDVWADGDGGGDETRPRKKYISLLSAFMLLTTWSTSSSNVLYPYTFGVLGVVGGPLFMLVAFLVNWTATRWTVRAARATNSQTFGALGEALAGRWGRVAFEGSQILFQQLFLPVAVVLCASAVQSLADYAGFASCNGNMAVLFAGVSFVLVQVSRELENVIAIAYGSCALMLVMTITIAVEVSTAGPPSSASSSSSSSSNNNSSSVFPVAASNRSALGNATWEYFVGMGDHPERYHWANIFSAIGIFIYSCLPSCIVVETMAALRPSDRDRMTLAVDGSFLAYISVYLVAGLPAVVHWGGDLPVPIEFTNSAGGIIIKVVLIVGTLLDFVLASTTVNRWVLRVLKVRFDFKSWSARSMLTWLKYSWPSSLLAVLMALVIPRLESLTGLLDSIAGSTLQVTAVPLALWLTSNTAASEAMEAANKNKTRSCSNVQYAAAALYGLAFTVVVLISACYNIAVTRYTADPALNETFWCDLAG